MATIDLGKVALVWKGTYAAGTTYESKDVVQFTDSGELSSYIYVNTSNVSGQTPSSGGTVNTTYWNKMAGGTSLSVGNTKIVTTGASGVVNGLAIGSAGEVLKVNSGANGFEFGSGAKVRQVVQGFNSSRASLSSSVNRVVYWNALNFTKQLANSKLHVEVQIPLGGAGDTYPGFGIDFIRFSTTDYSSNGSDIFGYLNNTRATTNNMGAFVIGNFLYDTTGTNIAAAGSVYVDIGYDSADSGSTWRPAPIWNPNASEDPRGRQSFSTIVITEIE